MNNNNTKSIKILASRCLEATLVSGEIVVLNPKILVSYYNELSEIKLKGEFEEYSEISLVDITEINGVAFSGTYSDLRTEIDALVIAANYTASGGGGTGGDVTIIGDSVGLAKQTTFDEKYTGYTIDLDDPSGDSFNGFPFECKLINIATAISSNQCNIGDFSIILNRIEDLINLLNVGQSYYYFTKVSSTVLGVVNGEITVPQLLGIDITDDTNGSLLTYEIFPYIVAAVPYTTQDLIAQEKRISNSLLSGSNSRIAESLVPVNFSLTAVSIAPANSFRKTITITNTSSSVLFLSINSTPTLTDYKYRLPQNGVVIIDDTTEVIRGIWNTGAIDGTALINLTY